eukprot:3986555-Amphidinium_carterae.1
MVAVILPAEQVEKLIPIFNRILDVLFTHACSDRQQQQQQQQPHPAPAVPRTISATIPFEPELPEDGASKPHVPLLLKGGAPKLARARDIEHEIDAKAWTHASDTSPEVSVIMKTKAATVGGIQQDLLKNLNHEPTKDSLGFLFATTRASTGVQRQLNYIPAEIEMYQLRAVHFDLFHEVDDITKFLFHHEFPTTAEIPFTVPQYIRHIRTSVQPHLPVYVTQEDSHLVNDDIVAIIVQNNEAAPLISLINKTLAVQLVQFQPSHPHRSSPGMPAHARQLQGGARSDSTTLRRLAPRSQNGGARAQITQRHSKISGSTHT